MSDKDFSIFKEIIEMIPQIIKNSKICLDRELTTEHDAKKIEEERAKFRHIMEMFEGKWTIDILYMIYQLKSPGFNLLLKMLPGINSRTLTDRLILLEDHGIIRRIAQSTRPIRVNYEMTEFGKTISFLLLPAILFCAWPEIGQKKFNFEEKKL